MLSHRRESRWFYTRLASTKILLSMRRGKKPNKITFIEYWVIIKTNVVIDEWNKSKYMKRRGKWIENWKLDQYISWNAHRQLEIERCMEYLDVLLVLICSFKKWKCHYQKWYETVIEYAWSTKWFKSKSCKWHQYFIPISVFLFVKTEKLFIYYPYFGIWY